MLYTRIEDLSNEIFYDIFEYMECYDVFNGFSNLNTRFEILLNYPFLSLNIHVNSGLISEIRKYCTQYIIPNKHRIVSLYLTDRLHIDTSSSLYILDSSFIRLQSIIFNQIRHDQFISLLPTLTCLPHLASMTINFNDNIVNLTEIYRLIFCLSYLKKLEILAKGYSLTMALPMNKFEQFSHIKHMIINHACNLTELIALLSYTPLLVHLTCTELSKQDQLISKIIPFKMSHLSSISFSMCNAQFDQLEIFTQNLCNQLRMLYINISLDVAYLDANRWEQLISQYMPYLRVFKFGYDEYHYQRIELASHHSLLNKFTSSFWINRGWFFQITVDIDYWPPVKVTYSLTPDRKNWCHIYKENTNIKLTIDRLDFTTSRENLVDKIFSFICTFPITHLIIDCKKLSYNKFLQLLCKLPNLHSLAIISLSYFKVKSSSQQTIEFIQSWLDHNQIIQLEIRSFTDESDLEKIQYFIDLCTQMKYLQVKCEHICNINLILRYILRKNMNKFYSFNLFCLWIPITNDDIIKQLQRIIHLEHLLIDNYKITRTSEKIFLQWKLE